MGTREIVALLSLYWIWGSTYLTIKVHLQHLPIISVMGFRFTLAGLLLLALAWMRNEVRTPSMQELRNAAWIGSLLMVSNGYVAVGQKAVPTGVAAMVISSVPLWVVMILSVLGKPPAKMEWLGVALGLIGTVILNAKGDLHANPLSATILLGCALVWAIGSVWSGRIQMIRGMYGIALQMICGGPLLLLLGYAIHGERIDPAQLHAPAWAAFFYLVIFASIISFSSYTHLLRTTRPTIATSYAFVCPAVAVGLGVSLGGETLTSNTVLALAFLMTGVGLILWGKKTA